jgi:hypothetical protein
VPGTSDAFVFLVSTTGPSILLDLDLSRVVYARLAKATRSKPTSPLSVPWSTVTLDVLHHRWRQRHRIAQRRWDRPSQSPGPDHRGGTKARVGEPTCAISYHRPLEAQALVGGGFMGQHLLER